MQRAVTGALYTAELLAAGYHNCNLCGQHSYSGGSRQLYRNIPALTRNPLLHLELAKGMENQS